MRAIDAQLRVASSNSLVGWAASLVVDFKNHYLFDQARLEVAECVNRLQKDLEICQEELDKIQKEAGVMHQAYQDGVVIRSRHETMHGYVMDLLQHADKGTLLIAKKQCTLLYQVA